MTSRARALLGLLAASVLLLAVMLWQGSDNPVALPSAPPYSPAKHKLVDLGHSPYYRGMSQEAAAASKRVGGVVQVAISGREVDHPVATAQFGLAALASYEATHDREWLDLAIESGEGLLRIGRDSEGALLFPYEFDYENHGGEVLRAPWWSAMAQGQALSLFSRIAGAQNETKWTDAAHRVFASLARADQSPPLRFVDEAGLTWFEEYVSDSTEPMKVVNGHLFTMIGIYDYWRLTKSGEAATLFNQGLNTMVTSFRQFRVKGSPSMYCLREPLCSVSYGSPAEYHRIVEQLLEASAAIVEDPSVLGLAWQLHEDSP